MDGTCLALSVAQTLFAALQCSELKGLFSMWGYKSELQNLESTVKTIKAVLLSADSKHALTPQEWDFIDNLKDVVYEADDLIDEFVTLVALQQQHQSPGKVRSLFKRFEKLSFAYKTSQKVKSIRKKMDRVADDASKFCFKIDDLPIRNRREETCSYVNVNDIVGRDDDREKIVHMLLDPNLSQEDVSVVTIVGVGGLGKTALAQLVYNDPRTVEEFPLRMWVCVSDQDQNQFDVKPILVNILNSTSTSLEQVVQELRKKLVEKKYLLVLDDVWTENHGDWIKLKSCLLGLNQRGNKIVVTTRSEGTAVAVESSHTYKLQGLSDESSWCLFEMVVGYKRANSPDLVEIGRDIVKKCVNVPLALKVVGSLLYGQERNTWVSFQKSRLSEVRKTENDIMSILEFSYRNLSSSLRSCFIYCALFPKDFELDKGELLELWMAQGYVEPLDEGQNIEDAAQECFQILARRCFFQDLKILENEKEVTFKIHDLMHDLAQQVAGKEISIAYSTTSTLNKGIRHLYDAAPSSRKRGFIMVEAKIRTFLAASGGYNIQFPISTLPENWRSLRTLELCRMGLSSLPDTIGQLLHLRYLNLWYNRELTMLPKSLTKLINLQFLNVDGCYHLKELPADLSKLVNLRTLYVEANGLKYMPLGLGKMTRLTRLNWFVVGEKKSSLEELKGLSNLKGHTGIRICRNYKHAKEYCGKGEYICHIENLNSICIEWAENRTNEEVRLGNDEEVLEGLQPHTNLKELSIWFYQGVRMGGWAREDSLTTSLPNLVNIELWSCDGLKEFPWLGRLQHLKTLNLNDLKNVEYMENRRSIGCSSNDEAEASNSSTPLVSSRILFFPSLETLQLYSLNNLKGWWMGEDEMLNTAALPSFPCLSYLRIYDCKNLTSFPLCPCVETLRLSGLNERFEGIMIKREEGEEMGVGGSSSSRSCDSGKIKPISADKLLYLKYLEIGEYAEGKSMSEWEELFRSCSPTLCSLKLYDVPRLPKGMHYLTSLQSLELHFSSMKEIPEWIECLSSLQSLTLNHCRSIESLPIEMKNLTSLKRFELRDCGDYFQRRCKSPDGEYWPILQHIPTITIE